MEDIIRKSFPLYNLKEKLGGGQFGEVYLIEDEFKKRAVKVVPMEQERSSNYRTSDAMAEKLDRDFKAVKDFYELIKGDGVLRIYDFHVTKKEKTKRNAKSHLLVVMKYYPDNLLDYVLDHPAVPPKKAEKMIKDLATALRRLTTFTDETFLVTDLKPSNILLDEDEKLLIGDLGGIKKMGSVASRSRGQMTLDWSAPETVFEHKKPDVRSMIFSFGLVAYFIMESKRPYENKEEDFLERFRMMEADGVRFERTDLPKHIVETVKNCLAYKPEKRPRDFAAVLEMLEGERKIFDAPSLEMGTPVTEYKDKEQYNQAQPIKDDTSKQIDKIRTFNVKGVSFNMVYIPPGSFMMGSPPDEKGRFEDETRHKVILTMGYYLGETVVTQELWKAVASYNPSYFLKGGHYYPVEQVSWNDCREFIQKLNDKTKENFRLPTEAEWEYAARAGTTTPFAFGECLSTDDANYNGNYPLEGCSKGEYRKKTVPVKSFRPNAWGLYEMHGNVWEWCSDVYQSNAYSDHTYENPTTQLDGQLRVYRGGGWYDNASSQRSAKRFGYLPNSSRINLGFRLALSSGR